MHPLITKNSSLFLALILFSIFFSSCKDDDIDGNGDGDNDPVFVCDSTRLPIIMAHGFLASGDTYTRHIQRFSSNNYCDDFLYPFDWNSLGQEETEIALDAFVDKVLLKTGASQVNLVGHSAGGGLGYTYLSDPIRAAKVNRYAHVGSFGNSAPAGENGDVPTLNLYSTADMAVSDNTGIPEAENIALIEEDHYEVATSDASFRAIYEFFNDTLPETTEIKAQESVSISGRALTFGENIPEEAAVIEIYELDDETGFRMTEAPVASFVSDIDGAWGPFIGTAGIYYEFVVLAATADAPVHYYREPFTRSNPSVYLRTIPPPTSLAGLFLSGLPSDDAQSVVVVFSSSQAVIDTRDELLINDFIASNATLCSADQTSIALFFYDDGDSVTSETPNALFASFPFLNGADIFYSAENPQTITANFNGRIINARNWGSATEGQVVFVLD